MKALTIFVILASIAAVSFATVCLDKKGGSVVSCKGPVTNRYNDNNCKNLESTVVIFSNTSIATGGTCYYLGFGQGSMKWNCGIWLEQDNYQTSDCSGPIYSKSLAKTGTCFKDNGGQSTSKVQCASGSMVTASVMVFILAVLAASIFNF